MGEASHRTGTVQSGDVTLFYRAFGPERSSEDKTPVIILHGSNYFDSYDWIGVASGLSQDRQVVVFDHRGFGRDYFIQQLLLGAEMIMYGRQVDLRLRNDLPERSGRETLFGEPLRGQVFTLDPMVESYASERGRIEDWPPE